MREAFISCQNLQYWIKNVRHRSDFNFCFQISFVSFPFHLHSATNTSSGLPPTQKADKQIMWFRMAKRDTHSTSKRIDWAVLRHNHPKYAQSVCFLLLARFYHHKSTLLTLHFKINLLPTSDSFWCKQIEKSLTVSGNFYSIQRLTRSF